MAYELPPLPYSYDSLEPYIDNETMQFHHTKHHKTYVDKLNEALVKYPDLSKKPIEDLLKNINNISEDIKLKVAQNGGQHFNHSFFWQILKKNSPISGEILAAIEKKFNSFENFKIEFSNLALGIFGSGWAWLAISDGELELIGLPNHENPLMFGKKPILALDVWEHAYYLKYKNKRADYIEAFFNIINWQKVNQIFLEK